MRKINFGAGPAALNESVLKKFAADMIDFEGSGVGVGELSHRGKAFESKILAKASESILELSGFRADQWQVLWMTGGGTGQFSAIPLNLLNESAEAEKQAVYLITGCWSEKAAEEAGKLIGSNRIISIDLRCLKEGNVKSLREPSDWLNELKQKMTITDPCYFYYCDNETVDGLELPSPDYFQTLLNPILNDDEGAVFVVDASSNFLSRPLADPQGRTAIIFAGVQKNLGAAGVTTVLIKRKLLENLNGNNKCPAVLDYKLMAKHNSLLNTPPVLAIHLCNLMLQDLRVKFPAGLAEIDRFSREKSRLIYEAIEGSPRGLWCPVDERFRSRMNVVFNFKTTTNVTEEEEFIKEAEGEGMIQLKGHRSVGGMRASLYNAITIEQVNQLRNLIMKY